MLRVDVPVKGDFEKNGWETFWYGGAAIFGMALTDEATALRMNKPYEPPSYYRLPPPDMLTTEDDEGAKEDDTEEVEETPPRTEAPAGASPPF
jgi:hypothetical protein